MSALSYLYALDLAPSGDSKITCRVTDTVLSLKESVSSLLAAQGKNVRLIVAGKMLDVDHSPLSKYGVIDGSFVHAVITSIRGSSLQHNPVSTTPRSPINYRGFDRLTQLGLTVDDTAALRSSFNPQVNAFISTGGHQAQTSEDSTEFRFRMEEEWIASQGARSEFSLNLPSDRARRGQHGAQSTLTQDVPAGEGGYGFSFSAARRGETGGVAERPSNPGTMNDFFWGLAMG